MKLAESTCPNLNEVNEKIKSVWKFILSFIKWTAIAATTGVAGGLAGTLFHTSVEKAKELNLETYWALGLPGKVAPRSAAKYMAEKIISLM